jgi:putative OPT family oligopeptide transporter
MEHQTEIKGLPPNAYTELAPGEVYEPIVPADKPVPEVTTRSVILGLVMALIFSAATAFLGFKIGNIFEAAIPIAILAVGISYVLPRKSTILENVITQSIGSTSGAVVAGAVFTLPALFILKSKYPEIAVSFFKIFTVSLLGGVLGIVFLIFFRKYFVSDMHGKFPFPEGTATTEVLVTGQEGGSQAKTLAISMGVAAIYDFCVYTLEMWKEVFTTNAFAAGAALADKLKLLFKLNVTAAIIGTGYIVGLQYSAIICAGSFFAWFVVVPLIAYIGANLQVQVPPVADGTLISAMDANMIFKYYPRYIGIGGIACAGVIGIIKSSGIIVQAFSMAMNQIFKKKSGDGEASVPRTQLDMPMSVVFSIIIAVLICIFLFFWREVLAENQSAFGLAVIALLVVFIISFLFTTVAARAIAIIGSNPVSGMTLMTLIISSVILVQVGLKGPFGMMAALLIGGVVCTSLSMSGSFITDLKIGYWIGATPRNQQRFKFLGTLVSALAVACVVILLNNTYGFVPDASHPADKVLPAPQANAMAAVLETVMSNNPVPWLLYIVGILLTLTLEMIGIPPLAFMLGVYLPLELNTPILAGGILAHLVEKSHPDPEIGRMRKGKGTLIASGLMAGGAIIGVISAIIKYIGTYLNEHGSKFDISTHWEKQPFSEWLSLIMFILLGIFIYWYATRDDKPAAPSAGNEAAAEQA